MVTRTNLHCLLGDVNALDVLDVFHKTGYCSHHYVVLETRAGQRKGFRERVLYKNLLAHLSDVEIDPIRHDSLQVLGSFCLTTCSFEVALLSEKGENEINEDALPYSKYFRAIGTTRQIEPEKRFLISSLILSGFAVSTTRISVGCSTTKRDPARQCTRNAA